MNHPSCSDENTKSISIPEPTDVFRDPIHGLIKIYSWEKELIETPEFQRLRRIHQLSMTYLIYHGAEHTRFGHSIGVMHVAGKIMDHLRHFEPLSNLTEKDFFKKKHWFAWQGFCTIWGMPVFRI